jgi:putative redox protein
MQPDRPGVATRRVAFENARGETLHGRLDESTGAFEATTFGMRVDDVVAAAAALTDETGLAPQLLVGHSLGGPAVIRAAERIPSVRAVAALGAPEDLSHTTRLFADALPEIEATGEATVTLAGRRFRIGRELVEDLRSTRLLEAVRDLGRPLLLLHSPEDVTVPIEHAARLYSAARHPKSFVALDGADHLLTRHSDQTHVAAVLAAWAGRYVDAAPA